MSYFDFGTLPQQNVQSAVKSALDWDYDSIKDLLIESLQNPTVLPQRYLNWVSLLYKENPQHVLMETFLIVMILYIFFVKSSYNPRKKGFGGKAPPELSEAEMDELIEEWEPEPLVDPTLYRDHSADVANVEIVLESTVGPRVKVRGYNDSKINLASYDFLGIASDERLKEVSRKSLLEYGCGSCGPRGFYGTTLAHLKCESDLAEYFDAEEAICYSDANSTISSVIPCFAKRGDVLILDSGVSHPLLVGAQLSRAKVYFFRHNDMKDLVRVLKKIRELDRKANRAHGSRRHFIVAEGLYRDHGDFSPLAKLLAIKREYACRLVIDDSFGCFCVGKNGRGVLDLANVSDVNQVDLFSASCAGTLSSIGGFAVGEKKTINYQRLAGAGYCFSASQPPFSAAVCSAAIHFCNSEEGAKRRDVLASKALHFRTKLAKRLPNEFLVTSDNNSPMMHLRLCDWKPETAQGMIPEGGKATLSRNDCDLVLQSVSAYALERGVLVKRCVYTPPPKKFLQQQLPPPSIRLCISAGHVVSDIDTAVDVLVAACESVVEKIQNLNENAIEQLNNVAKPSRWSYERQ